MRLVRRATGAKNAKSHIAIVRTVKQILDCKSKHFSKAADYRNRNELAVAALPAVSGSTPAKPSKNLVLSGRLRFAHVSAGGIKKLVVMLWHNVFGRGINQSINLI
jgi:hypothetical protein